MSTQTTTVDGNKAARYLVVAVFTVAAFIVAYQLASARSSAAERAAAYAAQTAYAQPAAGDSGGCGCGDGGLGTRVEGAAALEGDGVQRIVVDTSAGYDPNVIKLQAGVPAEITFGPAYGCTAQVMSQELGFYEDLQSGPKTVALQALEPGTFGFSCGMQMVFGEVVVE